MLDYAFVPINIMVSLLIMGLGYLLGGWTLAISWLVWGIGVRMVTVLHATCAVNSTSHM